MEESTLSFRDMCVDIHRVEDTLADMRDWVPDIYKHMLPTTFRKDVAATAEAVCDMLVDGYIDNGVSLHEIRLFGVYGLADAVNDVAREVAKSVDLPASLAAQWAEVYGLAEKQGTFAYCRTLAHETFAEVLRRIRY